MKVQLTLDESDARIVTKALELYTRLGLGQFEEILDLYRMVMPVENIEPAGHALDRAKMLMTGFEGRQSHGISNQKVAEPARRAYEIGGVVRKLVAENTPGTPSYSTHLDEPLSVTGKSFPTVTLVNQE